MEELKLSLEEKLNNALEREINGINLDFINYRFIQLEHCQSIVGKEIKIGEELYSINSVADRRPTDDYGLVHNGAFKFYLSDSQGSEIQYLLNPELSENSQLQNVVTTALLGEMYRANRNEFLPKFNDEDSDFHLGFKVRELNEFISPRLDKIEDNALEIQLRAEFKEFKAELNEASDKIDFVKTPYVEAMHLLEAPFEKLETLKEKLETMFPTEKITESQETASSFQKRIDFIKTWEMRADLPWQSNDVLNYLSQGITEKERGSFMQKLPEELQLKFNAKNPFLIKGEILKGIADHLNGANSFLTKEEAIKHIADKPNRIASNTQANDNKEIWNQINKLDIIDYICAELGGTINRKSTTKKSTVMNLPGSNEKLLIRKYEDGKYGIANDSFSFKGTNVSFIAAYKFKQFSNVSKQTLAELVNHLKERGFIENNQLVAREVQYKYTGETGKPNAPKKAPKPPKTKHFVNLKFSALLHDRGILPSTLNSGPFRGLVQNSYLEEKSEIRNLAFKFRDRDNKVFTFLEKNQAYQKFQQNQSTEGLLFLSNPPKGQIENIVIGEAPIDILSYAQHKGIDNDNTLYVATGGNINDGQLNVLNAIVTDVLDNENFVKQNLNVFLANDQDNAGIMYDFKISQALSETVLINHSLDTEENREFNRNALLKRNDDFYKVYYDKEITGEEKSAALLEIYNKYYSSSAPITREDNERSVFIQVDKSPIGKDWNDLLVTDLKDKGLYQSTNLFNSNSLPEFKDFVDMEKNGVESFFQQLGQIVQSIEPKQEVSQKPKL